MKVAIHPELTDVVRAGVLRFSGMILPADKGAALWRELSTTCQNMGEQYRGLTSGQVPGVGEARKLYRAIGLDPTKTRPSSEALLRRVLKGKGLYRIHPLVDLFNAASLAGLLPVGLYDESKVVGERITIRIGKTGWGFDGIRKDRVNVEGRLCVVDDEGPFGSPTSDSLRTSIAGPVERALAIFFQHPSGDIEAMETAASKAVDLAAQHLRASIDERYIL